MRKIINILFVLSLCFFTKAQAQDEGWTEAQIDQVEQEITWIDETISINQQQQSLLFPILLRKNEMLLENVRVAWQKKIVLDRMEDIIRYGEEINRHPEHGSTQLPPEIYSENYFDEKVRNNQELLEKLNLNLSED